MSSIIGRYRGIPAQDGAGVKLTRIINQPGLSYQDPFLMLDEFRSDDPNDYIAGFPPHPHRGFCTLTYMLAGRMEHKDSEGNTGVVEAGGVQWMKAARGIIHAEMPKQESGLMWGFQLWVNLPAAEKMSPADWADYPADAIPEVNVDNATVRVIGGELFAAKGPVEAKGRDFLMADIVLHDNTSLTIPSQQQAARLMYVYRGSLQINGEAIERGEIIKLDSQSDLALQGTGAAILLAGKPIAEPIAQYGPFVMNTHQEVEQAIRDYQSGQLTAS
ncbi:hypothetical protein CWI84_05820 [Idiomarina tyrosinivorans]|uniref:Quercetin 2,3-dioxygenase n=1 Tax=Idiomarina tyrosinivorans TaxID=1445662 RepID=A0A432ZRM6_9GAMM|nr:pirin family protein [Idiomarina tyrosinivorans]RUO80575.1 hypothetical protein CWI84_05820 [Idiomarina tyrosinivorans]